MDIKRSRLPYHVCQGTAAGYNATLLTYAHGPHMLQDQAIPATPNTSLRLMRAHLTALKYMVLVQDKFSDT